jgi:hypothetical protein
VSGNLTGKFYHEVVKPLLKPEMMVLMVEIEYEYERVGANDYITGGDHGVYTNTKYVQANQKQAQDLILIIGSAK